MTKKELIAKLSERSGFNLVDTENFLNTFTDTIIREIKIGERVVITGFGTFERVESKERESIHPLTKQTVVVPAKRSPKFRASKNFKDIVA